MRTIIQTEEGSWSPIRETIGIKVRRVTERKTWYHKNRRPELPPKEIVEDFVLVEFDIADGSDSYMSTGFLALDHQGTPLGKIVCIPSPLEDVIAHGRIMTSLSRSEFTERVIEIVNNLDFARRE